MKNHSFCTTVTETHTHKNTPPWVTSATASYAIHGSPLPVPAGRTCVPRRGQCWACSVYFLSPGGVSSVTFFTSARESDFFLTLVTYAAASAAACCCPSPDSAQHACLPYYGQCRARAVLLNSRCGGCFGRQNVHHRKKERVTGPRP